MKRIIIAMTEKSNIAKTTDPSNWRNGKIGARHQLAYMAGSISQQGT